MRSKRKDKITRFAIMPWDLLDSPEWAKLTSASKVAYLHLKRQITNPNPGALSLSYHNMEKIMNRRTFSRSLKQLEKEGFITKEQTGGLFRQKNWFKFSEKWRQKSSGPTATVTSGPTATVEEIKEERKPAHGGPTATC